MHLANHVFLITLIHHSLGFSFMGVLKGMKDNIYYYSVSPFFEQCDSRWIKSDIQGLEKDLHSYVFGQELASDVVLVALRSHSSNSYKKKPLVLNFHGWPGGGKGYVADFILKNWFKEGEKSKFVKKYLSKLHFPLKSEVHTYQKRLQRELEDTVRRCPRSMFVFDEVDKYPPHLLDGIKPYLDYNTNVNGVDFRQAVFIFITNNGDELINKIVLRKRKNGFSREDLKLSDFEHMLKTESFNDEGGFYKSDMIKHHLIDHVVPFLPLEREHVASCVQAEFLFQGGHPSFIQDVISEIISEITFGPDGDEIYSINGCKVISNKVAYILEREKRRRRRRKFEEDL